MSAASLLETVETAIATMVASGIAEYTLNDGRSVRKLSLAEMQALRLQLKGEVASETASGGMVSRTYTARGGGLH